MSQEFCDLEGLLAGDVPTCFSWGVWSHVQRSTAAALSVAGGTGPTAGWCHERCGSVPGERAMAHGSAEGRRWRVRRLGRQKGGRNGLWTWGCLSGSQGVLLKVLSVSDSWCVCCSRPRGLCKVHMVCIQRQSWMKGTMSDPNLYDSMKDRAPSVCHMVVHIKPCLHMKLSSEWHPIIWISPSAFPSNQHSMIQWWGIFLQHLGLSHNLPAKKKIAQVEMATFDIETAPKYGGILPTRFSQDQPDELWPPPLWPGHFCTS